MTESQPIQRPGPAGTLASGGACVPAGTSPGMVMRVMFSAEQIARRVRELGLELARDYQDKRPLFVGVLKGACMFQCDLARATPIDLDLDFVSVSSYGAGQQSSGNVRLLMDLREDVANRHVVLCEGVVDSGLSVSFILDVLKRRRPASLRVATLLDKVPCRRIPVPVDYWGWKIGCEFVVGYGMDDAERCRNLPYVGVLEEAGS
jgi:hypoxanthine phosphoribosyltransferase